MSELKTKIVIEGDASGAKEAARQTESALGGIGQAGKQAGNGLEAAFGTAGVRSAAAIQAEIAKINAALATLKQAADVSAAEFERAFAAGQAKIAALRTELNGTLGATVQSATGVSGAMDGITKTAGPMGAALAAAFAGDKMARTAVEMDSLARTFKAITGSAQGAAQEMDYIAKTANRLGLEVGSASKSYANFAAATKGTALEGQAARDIFEAVAGSFSQLGKSSAETEGALLALSQMVSKGVVSMEELRGQLGERLPGAMKVAADSMGLTQQDLIKLVESGQVLAVDLLPRLATGLKTLYNTGGQVNGFSAEWHRLTNTVTLAIGKIAETPVVMHTVGATLFIVRGMIAGLGSGVLLLAEGFSYLGKTVGTAMAVLNGKISGKEALDDLAKAADESAGRIAEFARQSGLAKDKTAELAAANRASAEAAGASAQAQLIAGQKVVDLYQKYSKELEGLAAVEAARQRNAEARIGLAGTEAQVLAQLTGAAERQAQIAELQAAADQAAADAADRKVRALEASFAALKELSPEQQKMLDEQRKEAQELGLVAEKSLAAANAMEIAAEKAQLAAAAERDNSARLAELKQAYENATVAVAAYEKLKDGSPEKAEAYAAAVRSQRDALYLYRDALKDTVEAEKQKEQAVQRATALEAGAVGVQIEAARASQNAAKARGQEALAIREGITVKELEAKQSAVVAEGKRREAEAAKVSAAAQIEAIKASGEMTPAKEREIAAINDAVKARQLEAEAAKQVANASAGEADAARNAAQAKNESAAASDKSVEATGKATQSSKAFSIAHADIARDLGLSGQAVEDFSRKFGEVLSPTLEKSRGIAHDYITSFKIGWETAENEAKRYAEALGYVNDLTERLGAASSGSAADLAGLVNEAEKAAGGIEGLGDQELSGLRSALASAKQQMESLKDSADSTLSSLQEELAQMNGNYAEAERLRYEARRADLEAQLALASAQGNSAAASALSRAIATLDQIAAKKIAEARQREAEELARAGKTSAQAGAAAAAASQAAGAVSGAVSGMVGIVNSAAQAASVAAQSASQSAAQIAAASGISSGGRGGGRDASLSGMTGGEGAGGEAGGETGGGESRRPESSAGEAGSVERRGGDGGSGSRTAQNITHNYTVQIHGAVLDVNDRVTLDTLGRKLAPVMAALAKRGGS